MPVTMADEEPTVATEVLLLLHVPPVTRSLNEVVPPAATVVLPDIGEGAGLTVKVIVVTAVPTIYVMVQVPAATPATIPVDEPTVAMEVLLLLQWPPAVESVNVLLLPAQTLAIPLIPETDVLPVTVNIM